MKTKTQELIDSLSNLFDWFIVNDWTELDIAINFACEYHAHEKEITKLISWFDSKTRLETARKAVEYAITRTDKEFIDKLLKVASMCLSTQIAKQ